MNNANLPQNSEEYMYCFRMLAAITNNAMDFVEHNQPVYLASLDRIAQSVETIASLRGDSGIYQNSRTVGVEMYQKEMYQVENQLRSRLLSLGYTYPTPRPLSDTA